MDLIDTLKVRLLNNKSAIFFSNLAYSLPITENYSIPTAAFKGGKIPQIMLNPDFVLKQDKHIQVAILCHELLHYALQHDLRKGNRNPLIWNMAGDHVINNMLLDMGYDVSNLGLLDRQYANKTTEEVYDELISEEKTFNSGDIIIPEDIIFSEEEGEELSPQDLNERNLIILDACNAQGKNAGTATIAELQYVVAQARKPKVNWRRELHQFASDSYKVPEEYKLNRRTLSYGLAVLQQDLRDSLGTVYVMLDVSGSISEIQLESFLSEIQLIKQTIEPEKLVIVTHNYSVVEVLEYTREELINTKVSLKIGGGTSFVQPMEFLQERADTPAFVVWFTDLYGEMPKAPNFPILWVIVDAPSQIPYYGKAIHITSGD